MIVDLLLYVAAFVLLIGSILGVLAAVGILRLPDLYTRLHAASLAGAGGAGLIVLVVATTSGDGAVAMRAVLGIVFLLLSTPVSAHLLARAARRSGLEPVRQTNIDIAAKQI